MATVTFREILDDDYEFRKDTECPPDCEFTIESDGLKVTFEAGQCGIKPERWERLINSIDSDNKKDRRLFFNDCNGCIGITYQNDTFYFEVSGSGKDNHGSMTLTVPYNKCIDAFRQAKRSLEEYYQRVGK